MVVHGEIIDTLIHDLGAELDLAKITQIAGHPAKHAPLVTRSPSPDYAAFPAPLAVDVPAGSIAGLPAEAQVSLRLHPVGAIAMRIRLPVAVADVDKLMAEPARGRKVQQALGEFVVRVKKEIGHALVEPYPSFVEPEPYTIVCLWEGAPTAADLLEKHRTTLAAVILGEPAPDRLSTATIDRAIRHTIRYYRDDALVIGWDNAVLVAEKGTYEDIVDVLEVGNLELLELRAYDAYLDRRLDEAFHSLDRLWARGGLFRSARSALADISEMRVDFARVTDNLRDTGKLFGDWYLAKVHSMVRDRFHLEDWERAVDEKMETLEDMFQLAEGETNHRRAMVLESMIVLLFILDLILIFVLAK